MYMILNILCRTFKAWFLIIFLFQIKPRYSFKRKEIRPGEFQVVHCWYPATVVGLKIIYLVNYSVTFVVCFSFLHCYLLHLWAYPFGFWEFEDWTKLNAPLVSFRILDQIKHNLSQDRLLSLFCIFFIHLLFIVSTWESFKGSYF